MTRRAGSSEEVSDEALLSGVAVGDDRATVVFVRRYQRRLFGLALTIVGEPGLAEDVAQEAFIRILRHASVFDARRGSVASWALAITRNLAIDAVRVRRPTPVSPVDRLMTDLVSTDRHPETAALLSDSLERLRRALDELPLEQRRAVVLAVLHGRTASEIAMEESIPLGTAKSRIRLGMARLRIAIDVTENS